MADERLYLDDPAPARARACIVERGRDARGGWVRLDRTVLYPGGGGQPPDRGTIDGARIHHVETRGGAVLHYVDGPLEEDEVTVELDTARRLEMSQQHTAQHLLTSWLLAEHGMRTTTFHLGESYAAIELDGPSFDEERLVEVEDEVNALVRRDPPVTTRFIDPGQMEELDVRSRLLPEGHTGRLRIVEIEGLDRNTCAGTHVSRLAEIQAVHLLGMEPARGVTRVHFLAGVRVLRRLRALRDVEDDLKARLGTSPDQFAAVVDTWNEERRALGKQVERLRREASRALARELAAAPGRVIVHRLADATPDALRALARALLELRPEAVVALAGEAGTPPVACFLVQSGPRGPEDVSKPGEAVRDALGARGGGRGRTFQGRGGRCPDAASLAEVVERTAPVP
jgi:Ser-tRNA(Ala) deacylase AlaX